LAVNLNFGGTYVSTKRKVIATGNIMKRIFSLLLTAWAILLDQQRTLATTRTVTSLNDDGGVGTLRTLIAASAAGDTIKFSITGTITLTSGELAIGRDLTIIGPGSPGIKVSGNNVGRVFNVSAGTISISNLTIISGKVVGVAGTMNTAAANGLGGAILNGGNLILAGCILTGNSAVGGAGPPAGGHFGNGGNGYGGAIYNLGQLLLNACTMSNNTAIGDNGTTGTPSAGGTGSGGGIYSQSTTILFHGVPLQGTFLTLVGCTLNNNSAQGGSGAGNGESFGTGASGSATGGALINHGVLVMTNCTIYANSATGRSGILTGFSGDGGDGGNAAGGGIWNDQHTVIVTVLGCTFSGNSATGGNGGSAEEGNGGSGGSAQGGGVFDSGDGNYLNTIIANDTVSGGSGGPTGDGNGANGSASGPDIDGAITSNGHNFISKTDGSSGWVASDRTGTVFFPFNPLLGLLANNGGPTLTLALQTSSAAIDAGDDTVTNSLATDQRGLPRLSGAHVDIGAYELQQKPESGQIYPSLTITYSGNQVIVLWPSVLTGWTLQTNNNLATGSWGNFSGQVVNNSVTNLLPKGNLFFRLEQ
jgi:hypothetical protein